MSDIIFNEKNEVIDLKNKNKADYKSLAKNNQLSEKFILENADFLDWNIISENQAFSIDLMLVFVKRIKWAKILINPQLSADMQLVAKYKADLVKVFEKEKTNITEDFVRRNYQHFNGYLWRLVSENVVLSEDFIREFRFLVDFFTANKKQKHLSQAFLTEFNRFIIQRVDNEMLRPTFCELTETEILENIDKMNWSFLCHSQVFSEKFISQLAEKMAEKVDNSQNRSFWECICYVQPLSEDFIAKFENKIDFGFLTNNLKSALTEKIIRKYPDKNYGWSNISENYALSAAFIEDFKDKIIWERLSCNKMKCLTEEIILKYKDKWYSDWIWYCQKLSEPFIRELIANNTFKVNWEYLSERQSPIFSLQFFQDFADKINWWKVNYINIESKIYSGNAYKNFDDAFVKGLAGKAQWYYISEHSPVSESFLRENLAQIDWNRLFLYQFHRLSKEFRQEFGNNFGWTDGKNYEYTSEAFVREFSGNVDWNLVYTRMLQSNLRDKPQYSEEFVRNFLPKNKTDWANVANKMFLSEAFMTDFADKLDFKLLSKTQVLSEDFMRKFEKKLDWKNLFKTQRMSAKFIQEFKHKIA